LHCSACHIAYTATRTALRSCFTLFASAACQFFATCHTWMRHGTCASVVQRLQFFIHMWHAVLHSYVTCSYSFICDMQFFIHMWHAVLHSYVTCSLRTTCQNLRTTWLTWLSYEDCMPHIGLFLENPCLNGHRPLLGFVAKVMSTDKFWKQDCTWTPSSNSSWFCKWRTDWTHVRLHSDG